MAKLPKIAKPSIPPVIQGAAQADKPKLPFTARTLLTVFKPLIWLLPLAVLALLVYYLVPNAVKIGKFTIDFKFYSLLLLGVIAGVLVCWVLIRLVRYMAARRRIKKQEELLGKAEALHLQENFDHRFQRVINLLKSSQIKIYDMPWYIVMGDQGSNVHALLEEQALSFSSQHHLRTLMDGDHGLDRWVFTNDAVFIDTTGYSRSDANRGAQQAELDAFLNRLLTYRHRCPLNGLVLAVSAIDLVKSTEAQRKQRAKEILSEIRQIQDFLSLRLPLYLVVTRMEGVLGFADYFNELSTTETDQIFGWSNPNPPGIPFQSHLFPEVFKSLVEKLKLRRFSTLGISTQQDAQLRGGLFPEEFALMQQPLTDYIETLFVDNRFTDPPIFRGVFFTGGREVTELATRSCSQYLKAPALEFLARAVKEETAPRSLFTRDLFSRKIFQEPGVVTRPHRIFQKNVRIKLAAYLTAVGLVILLGIHMSMVSRHSARELEALSADLNEAGIVLNTPKSGDDMLDLCMRLDQHKQRLKQASYMHRILDLGRSEEVQWDLGVIHRSIFQETSLDTIIAKTEDRLASWQGFTSRGDPGFAVFASALEEYSLWSNTYFGMNRRIDLRPFLDFLQVNQKQKYNYLEQFKLFMKEGGRTRRIVSPAWEDNIRQALQTARLYLRPSLRDLQQPGWQFTDTEWWLDLAVELQEFKLNYTSLLETDPPKEDQTLTGMTTLYFDFKDNLFYLLSGRDRMVSLLEHGQGSGVVWIDPNQFYEQMRSATRGIVELEKILEKDQQDVLSDYRSRVVEPIRRQAPVVGMLTSYPGYSWLEDILVDVFSTGQTGPTSDYGVGNNALTLLDAMNRYDQGIQSLSDGFPAWKKRIGTRIPVTQQVNAPLDKSKFGLENHQLNSRIQALKKMTQPPAQAPAAAAGASKGASSQPQDDPHKAEVLAFWRVPDLATSMGQWLGVLDRRLMFAQSDYLEVMLDRADFQQGLQEATTWRAIKSQPLFAIGDGISVADQINDFLNRWLQDIPQPIVSLVKNPDNSPHYPEMAGFENMMKEAQILQSTYMPKLRVGLGNFVSCVQALDMDVNKAWQQLKSSPEESSGPGQPVSWQNFQALSAFKKSFEIDQGAVARSITGQLSQIENHVLDTFENELLALYHTDQKQYLEGLRKLGIGNKFPFKIDGPSMSVEEMLKFFSQLRLLNAKFEIAQPKAASDADAKSKSAVAPAPVPAPSAQRILTALSTDRWGQFFKDCMTLESYLFDKRTARSHKLQVSVVPGKVGQYYHWIRLSLGNGIVRDINVYGDPRVDITLTIPDGAVTLDGLDAARIPQASVKIAKGDFALFQMLYQYGRPDTMDRTTWIAEHEIPMAADPSISVNTKLRFDFKEGLPALPDIESILQSASVGHSSSS